MTLALLSQEYRVEHPDGYGYSQFCALYQQWAHTLEPVLRQHYVAGEKLLVDYTGPTVPVVDRATGEVREAQTLEGAVPAATYARNRGSGRIHAAKEAPRGIPRRTFPEVRVTAYRLAA